MRPIITIAFDDMFNVAKYREKFGVTLETPNFDRLAAMGAEFENAFASIAVCNPSRSSALTGLSPYKVGIHNTQNLQWHDVLPETASLVSVLDGLGYETFGTGKVFHDHDDLSATPFYDAHYDHHHQAPQLPPVANGVARALEPGEVMADDVNTAWAVDRLAEYDGSGAPMLMTAGIIRPHRPFIAPQEFFDLYPLENIEIPVDAAGDLDDVSQFYKDFRLLTNYDKNLIDNGLAKPFIQGYLASLSYADAKLGAILDAIDANPALDDALILAWSDHGYELGDKQTWNKFTLWEEAANIPLMLVDPSIAPGTKIATPVSLLDLMPTLIDAAGGAPDPKLDGRSLLDIAADPSAFADSVAITSMIGSVSMRTEDYRLIFYNDATIELYDMVADPDQRDNLADDPAQAALIDALTDRLKSELAAQGATFDPDAATLTGSADADSLIVAGAQTAAGGDGDDLYFVADGATIIETEDGGYDTVYVADREFDIPDHVEYVRTHIYANRFPFKINGNDQDNRVYAFASRTEATGGGGDDVLISSNARDTLDGGDGRDFIETASGAGNMLTGGADGDAILGGARSDEITGDIAGGASGDADILFGDGVGRLGPLDEFLATGDLLLANGAVIDEERIAFRREGGVLEDRDGPFDPTGFSDAVLALGAGAPGDFVVLDAAGDADLIDGGAGDDLIYAQGGDDEALGGSGDDRLYGDDGDDDLRGDEGDDALEGGRGDDALEGGLGDDRLIGGIGDDTAVGDSGNDEILGGSGDDMAIGGIGNDEIRGDAGDDVAAGGDGSDEILGGAGDDALTGGTGDDMLHGHGDADLLLGGVGDDLVFGGIGDDQAQGGAGVDRLEGHGGDDVLSGGPGDDVLVGGQGVDRFRFEAYAGADMASDFRVGTDLIAVDIASPLHGLTPQAILADHGAQDGADALIVSGLASLRLVGVALGDLEESFVFE